MGAEELVAFVLCSAGAVDSSGALLVLVEVGAEELVAFVLCEAGAAGAVDPLDSFTGQQKQIQFQIDFKKLIIVLYRTLKQEVSLFPEELKVLDCALFCCPYVVRVEGRTAAGLASICSLACPPTREGKCVDMKYSFLRKIPCHKSPFLRTIF